jgi:imidazolonepropionase
MMATAAGRDPAGAAAAAPRHGDLVVRHGRVLPLALGGVVRGRAPRPLPEVRDGAVAIVAGRIAYVGPDADLPAPLRALATLDAAGRVVLPGLVDCHSHVPFAAWRADEYAERLSGASYGGQQRATAGRPRGIARSAAQIDAASDDDVLAFSARRLAEALSAGATTFELKTGYGLSLDAEWRLMALMGRLAAQTPQRLVRTGLFLHGAPRRGDKNEWLETVLTELLPRAVAAGMLDGVDAFVEDVAYSLDQAAALLEAGLRAGLATHLHAEQLAPSGAAAWAAARGITSVDHLDHLDAAGVRALAASPTVAVLLPGATFLTGHGAVPPAADLLARGAAVAFATDLNPGTSPVASLTEAAALACRLFGVGVEDALAGVTVNAAAALALNHEVGSLEVGKRGDLVVLEGDEPALIAYRLGPGAIDAVVAAGRVVWAGTAGANAS